MFITISQLNRKDPIIINIDQIVNIRRKEDGNVHISLNSFGIDISWMEWNRVKEFLSFYEEDLIFSEGF